jgi:hypothetical protein
VSEAVVQALMGTDGLSEFAFSRRGPVQIKGKGVMDLYFIDGKNRREATGSEHSQRYYRISTKTRRNKPDVSRMSVEIIRDSTDIRDLRTRIDFFAVIVHESTALVAVCRTVLLFGFSQLEELRGK